MSIDRRDIDRRSDDSRHDMICAVAGRSVTVAIAALVPRQYVVDGIHQVVIAAGPGLDHGDSGCRMRDEDIEQAVTPALDKSNGVGREIENSPSVSGLDREDLGVHSPPSDVLALEDLAHRGVGKDGTDGACEDRSNREDSDLAALESLSGNGERVGDHELVDRSVHDPLDRRR